MGVVRAFACVCVRLRAYAYIPYVCTRLFPRQVVPYFCAQGKLGGRRTGGGCESVLGVPSLLARPFFPLFCLSRSRSRFLPSFVFVFAHFS